MNTATTKAPGHTIPKDAPPSARQALRLLHKLRHGALTLHLPDGSQRRFGEHPQQHDLHSPGHLSASITLHNWNVFAAALRAWYLAEVVHAPDFRALRQDLEVQDYQARAMVSGANHRLKNTRFRTMRHVTMVTARR